MFLSSLKNFPSPILQSPLNKKKRYILKQQKWLKRDRPKTQTSSSRNVHIPSPRWFNSWQFHPLSGGHQQPFQRVTFSPSQKGHEELPGRYYSITGILKKVDICIYIYHILHPLNHHASPFFLVLPRPSHPAQITPNGSVLPHSPAWDPHGSRPTKRLPVKSRNWKIAWRPFPRRRRTRCCVFWVVSSVSMGIRKKGGKSWKSSVWKLGFLFIAKLVRGWNNHQCDTCIRPFIVSITPFITRLGAHLVRTRMHEVRWTVLWNKPHTPLKPQPQGTGGFLKKCFGCVCKQFQKGKYGEFSYLNNPFPIEWMMCGFVRFMKVLVFFHLQSETLHEFRLFCTSPGTSGKDLYPPPNGAPKSALGSFK